MRVHLFTPPADRIIPFNYQPILTGALHKWLGPNDMHEDISLYSITYFGAPEKTFLPCRSIKKAPRGAVKMMARTEMARIKSPLATP